MRPYGSLVNNPSQNVLQLIDSITASWDMHRIQQVMLAITPTITSIPLCTRVISDFWSWNYEKNGLFLVRSAYKMLVYTKQRREAWLEGRAGIARERSSWGVQVPGKIRICFFGDSLGIRCQLRMSENPGTCPRQAHADYVALLTHGGTHSWTVPCLVAFGL